MTDQLSLFNYRPEPARPEKTPEHVLEPIAVNKDIPDASLLDLLPEDALLELNRSYPIQTNHASRILRLARERRAENEPIRREDVAAELGISWARVQGTINVMRKAELLRPKNAPTPFGQLVLARAPHFDDVELLWLLHFLLASNAHLVLWSHLFDQILVGAEEISVVDAAEPFQVLTGSWSQATLGKKVPKEIGGILRTYAEGLFAPLGLVTGGASGCYVIRSGTAVIPPSIWLASILVYRDRYYSGAPSLEVPLIVGGRFSPGRILRQKETAVRQALDALHNANMLTVETRSGLDQVRFKRGITWLEAAARRLEDRGHA